MAIIYNPNKKIFILHTAHTTYQMQVDPLGYLLHLYYGKKTNSSMDYVLTYADRGFSGNPYAAGMDRTYSLDALPQEYPSLGTGDYRNIALNIKNEKGVESADLLFKSYEIRSGKYQLQGLPAVWADENEAQTLEIVLADENAQVEVHLLYGVLEETDIITRSVRIKNMGTGQITIEKAAAACLDFVQGEFDVLRFYGKHAMERNLERTPLGHGTIAFGSRRGTSSHQYNPAVILAEKGTTETAGSCYGMLFVYSGNFSCEAEKDQFNQTRLLLGLNEELFSYPLASGETFTVPEVIAEAEYLYDLIKDYDLSYPVVFDMEQADESDRINTLSRGQKTMLAAAFVQAMRRHGCQVTIYGSQNWLQQDISMAVLQDEADFWLAAYDVEFPRFAYAYSCWQYSHTGTIDGISTLVDLDVMFVRK